MQIAELLSHKSKDLVTVGPGDSIRTAAEALSTNNIGALPVCDAGGNLVGILSERDIVHGYAVRGGDIDDIQVADSMSREVVTCVPEDDVNKTMLVMSENHFRHIPVLENGRLSAIVSSRDIMEAVLEEAKTQRNVMAEAYKMVR
tara:strand:- start:382 stop:816 length:435 start_codon:yes stop_codon:yes gene_type:complete